MERSDGLDRHAAAVRGSRRTSSGFSIPEDRIRVLMPDTGSAYGGKHTGEAALKRRVWLVPPSARSNWYGHAKRNSAGLTSVRPASSMSKVPSPPMARLRRGNFTTTIPVQPEFAPTMKSPTRESPFTLRNPPAAGVLSRTRRYSEPLCARVSYGRTGDLERWIHWSFGSKT